VRIGHEFAIDANPHVARRWQHVDAVMRIARVNEDLRVLVVPVIWRIPLDHRVVGQAPIAGVRELSRHSRKTRIANEQIEPSTGPEHLGAELFDDLAAPRGDVLERKEPVRVVRDFPNEKAAARVHRSGTAD
jgi:hypothetical protein